MLVLCASAPAWASAEHVIGPGQERRVERTLAGAAKGRVLQGVSLDRATVVVRYGRRSDGETTFAVTLVHPSTLPTATVVRGVAVSPEPGPADEAVLTAFVAALKAGGDAPVVQWTRLEEDVVAEGDAPGPPPGHEEGPEEEDPEEEDPAEEAPEEEASAADRDSGPSADDPAWTQAITRAEHLTERGDHKAARQVLATVAARAGDDPWRLVDLAAVYVQLGDVDRARALVGPTLRGPAGWLARALTDDLPSDSEVVAALSEDDPCGAAETARILTRIGRKDRAMSLLKATVAAGRCPRAVEAAGQLLLDARRQDDALAFLRAHRPTDPPDPGVETMIGHTLRNLGHYEESIAILEPLVRADPVAQSRLLAPLLTMYLWLGEGYPPLDDWRSRAQADPDDVVTTFLLGAVLHYRGEYEESLRWMDSLVGRLDDVPRVYIYRGMNRLNLGDPAGARELLDQATLLPYVDPDVYFCRAEVERDRDRELAIADLERFLTLKRKLTYSYGFKLFRVEQMLASLKRCLADGTVECPGPFEHPRDRFVNRFWQRLGMALAAALLLSAGIALWRRRRPA